MNKTLKTLAIGAIVLVCSFKVSCWAILNATGPSSSYTILDAEIFAVFSTAVVTTIVKTLRSRYINKK